MPDEPRYEPCPDCGTPWNIAYDDPCPGCGLTVEDLQAAAEFLDDVIRDRQPTALPDQK